MLYLIRLRHLHIQTFQSSFLKIIVLDHFVFFGVRTNKFDEVTEANELEKEDEISRLRKNLDQQLTNLQNIVTKLANKLKIEVHAGHGMDYKTTKILSNISTIKEFNIGHFIIGESIFYGLKKVIKKIKNLSKK